MNINSITLYNFKNECDTTVRFLPGVNVICGDNAAGKTNLLEGVFMFAAGKSFRGCKDRDMIRFGAEDARVDLGFCDKYGDKSFAIKLHKASHREIYREGIRLTKLSDFLGVFRAVIFTPDHLNLIKGSPEFRRKFVDMAICQSYPRFVAAVNQYNRVLEQKNALLRAGNADDDLLDVYNEKMSHFAGIITATRYKYIGMLEKSVEPFHTDISRGTESIRLCYHSNLQGDYSNAEEMTAKYMQLWTEHKNQEKARFVTLYGPHKDDFGVLINDKSAKTFASQGQQRSAVLSMKLAEGELSAKMTGEYPVFLLDDVLSELDEARQSFVLSRISAGQVLITGCERRQFETLKPQNVITVEKGNICTCI